VNVVVSEGLRLRREESVPRGWCPTSAECVGQVSEIGRHAKLLNQVSVGQRTTATIDFRVACLRERFVPLHKGREGT
jgi:hypothetical protein